jgi:hypothetical protein
MSTPRDQRGVVLAGKSVSLYKNYFLVFKSGGKGTARLIEIC